MTNEEKSASMLMILSARALELQKMKEFMNGYRNLIEAFHASHLSLLSTLPFRVGELKEFDEWKPYLMENKHKIMPIFISKMLRGDFFALSVFQKLSAYIITYDMLDSNHNIYKEYRKYGGAADALAIVTAKNWLTSEEAAETFDTFKGGREVECEINGLLEIKNPSIDCDGGLNF